MKVAWHCQEQLLQTLFVRLLKTNLLSILQKLRGGMGSGPPFAPLYIPRNSTKVRKEFQWTAYTCSDSRLFDHIVKPYIRPLNDSAAENPPPGESQVWPLTQIFFCFLLGTNHWSAWRANQWPLFGERLLSSVPPSNSLVSVSDHWKAFRADKMPFKGTIIT